MNRLSFAPSWPVIKERLKERFGHLTDDDFAEIELGEEGLLEQLHRRAGGSPFEIAHLVEETLERQDPLTNFVCLAFTPGEAGHGQEIPDASTDKEATAR